MLSKFDGNLPVLLEGCDSCEGYPSIVELRKNEDGEYLLIKLDDGFG